MIAGIRYLTQDLSLACGTPTHSLMKLLGGAVIALAGFGIPLTLAMLLRRPSRRNQMYSQSTSSSLGFLYDGYDVARGRYAVEAVVMLRKAGAMMIGNLIPDAFAQLAAALLLLSNMTGLQFIMQPFAVPIWSALDTMSLLSLSATLVLSIMYLRWATPAGMCAGLLDSDVLPGTTQSCAEIREQLASTDFGVTVSLLMLHSLVFAAFALGFFRLWRVRALRARLRSSLADSAAVGKSDSEAIGSEVRAITAAAPRPVAVLSRHGPAGRPSVARRTTAVAAALLQRLANASTASAAAADHLRWVQSSQLSLLKLPSGCMQSFPSSAGILPPMAAWCAC